MIKIERLKAVFAENGDEAAAASMAGYMQDRFLFYGIPAAKRKELTASFIRAEKIRMSVDWLFLDACYDDPHREMQYFALDCLRALQRCLAYDDIPHLLRYAQTAQWWDTIDILDRIIGDIGLKDDRVDEWMIWWSQSEDIWLRRLAIDHQNGRKEKTKPDLLEQILLNNLDKKEFFINKAVGWALRDYSKVDPAWVRSFIEKHKAQMSTVSLREAVKYLPV